MTLSCFIKKQGKLYSAVCLELDVASQGKTHKEACENLKEAIDLYVDDVVQSGDQKYFLRRRAPFKLWQEYYKAFTLNIIQEVKKSHHPKISLQQVLA